MPLRSVMRGAPENILIVKKENDKRVQEAFSNIVSYMARHHPKATLFHEDAQDMPPAVERWRASDGQPIDLVITLGGDGTVLRVSSLFSTGPVPPVLSFSMGTLGFLLPFHIGSFETAIHHVFLGQATVLPRMRLACKFYDRDGIEFDGCGAGGWQVMNEVTLHRGRSPHLTTVDSYVDGQHLTEAVADGLILSTPTGSTAYSLSSGGPIVHESVSALLLTPICPRSLSFRPLLLPGSSRITLQLSEKSRAQTAEVFMDGKEARFLQREEFVSIAASRFPIPCVNRSSLGRQPSPSADDGAPRAEDDWVRDINTLLQFNATFRNKDHGLLRPPEPGEDVEAPPRGPVPKINQNKEQ